MKLTYLGETYECVSAEKKQNKIVIHTGKYEDGEEIIYHIYGDIHFDKVILEGGTWTVADEPTQLDIIEAQVTYTAMMTDTLLEV
jgi:hypothetical protein